MKTAGKTSIRPKSGKITLQQRYALEQTTLELAHCAAVDGEIDQFVKLAVLIERQFWADRKSRKPGKAAPSTIPTIEDRKREVAVKLAGLKLAR